MMMHLNATGKIPAERAYRAAAGVARFAVATGSFCASFPTAC
jgi:hypothetical protein